MSQPTRHDYEFVGDEEEEAGQAYLTKTHDIIGFFVVAENATELDITIQGSATGETWTPISSRAPNEDDVFQVTEDDLVNGAYSISSDSYNVEAIRPFVRSADADSLEAYIFLNGQSNRGVQFGRKIDLPTQDND